MARVAILIDGGFLLKRIPIVRRDIDARNPSDVAKAINQLAKSHLMNVNKSYGFGDCFRLLYRTFYYDAKPYKEKGQTAVDNKPIDYAKTTQAQFRNELFGILRSTPNLALRLGEVRKHSSQSWILKPEPQRRLLSGQLAKEDLADDDFIPALRQKGVDMRIGIDIASITLKRQADTIVLVSGDADFVPAAKLARREGVRVILDPLWQNVSLDLYEHIDRLRSGFPKPPPSRSKLEPPSPLFDK